jgi:polyhydroxyalkanoate synthesis regulator phasin
MTEAQGLVVVKTIKEVTETLTGTVFPELLKGHKRDNDLAKILLDQKKSMEVLTGRITKLEEVVDNIQHKREWEDDYHTK